MDQTFLRLSKSLSFFVLTLALSACSSTQFFEVKSEPAEAEVFFATTDVEKKSIGKTPLKLTKDELKKIQGKDLQAGEFFTVSVEKSGFLNQAFSLPATSYGSNFVLLNVKLKEGTQEKEIGLAKEVLDRLFLAQRLALQSQFERAQIEIDKVLTTFPNFARALSMRASIYFAQKNYQESMKWYEETLKVDPDSEEVVKMLARVRSNLGLPPGTERLPAGTPKK